MLYRSKIDWWLALIIGITALGPPAAEAIRIAKGDAAPGSLLTTLLFCGFFVAVILLLAFPVQYEITASHLKIRSGVLRWAVPLAAIEQVYPTHNPLSSPALSLDRLKIDKTDGGFVMISPKDQDRFLRDLQNAAPHLLRIGDRLVRDGGPFGQSLL